MKGGRTAESEFVEHCHCEACGSSDAGALYTDGHIHCFSCGHTTGNSDGKVGALWGTALVAAPIPSDIPDGRASALTARGIHQETCEKWGYLVGTHNGRTCQIATYRDENRQVVAAKLRYADKSFAFAGEAKKAGLYGKWLWSGGGKMLTITEGEIDALSVSQAQGNKYPVVSVPNGAKAALRAIEKDYEWVCSFDRVNIWFDNDGPGQDATREVAEALPPGKCYVVKADLKDANEYIKAKRIGDITNLIWRAEPYRPDGIVCGADLWEQVSTPIVMGTAYPWDSLNRMLYGLRQREIVTITAGSGIGKSQLASEIAYHLAINEGQTIGYIALEEGVARTGLRFMGLNVNKPLHLPGTDLTDTERRAAFDATLGTGRIWTYDHYGSVDADNLINKMRYLVAAHKVQWIILDHLSIVVSGMELSGDERRMIDHTMTALRTFTEQTEVGLILVSHLRRPEGKGHENGAATSLAQLRGSASIAQLSDIVIGAERDQQAEGHEQNTLTLRVLKNRYSGLTGVATTLQYDRNTGRLAEHGPSAADFGF